jgi:hypothetical protein
MAQMDWSLSRGGSLDSMRGRISASIFKKSIQVSSRDNKYTVRASRRKYPYEDRT